MIAGLKLDPIGLAPLQKSRDATQKESLRDWMKRTRDNRKQNPHLLTHQLVGGQKLSEGRLFDHPAHRHAVIAKVRRNGLGFGPNYAGRQEHHRSLQDVRLVDNSPPRDGLGGAHNLNQTVRDRSDGNKFFERKFSSQFATQNTQTKIPPVGNQAASQLLESQRKVQRDKVPCIVFSTGNELVTPGPDAYDVKIGDIADKLERGYGVTFKGKNVINNRSPELSPGPADYIPDVTISGGKKNAFSIGRAAKEAGSFEKVHKSPGPGAYDGNKPHRIKGTVMFDSIKRSNSIDNTPGPGQYDVSLLLKRRIPKMPFPTAPRFQQSLKEKILANVAPTTYNPLWEAGHPRRTGVKFGTETRSTGLTKPSALTYSTGSLLDDPTGHNFSKTQINFASSSNLLQEKHVPAVQFSGERRFQKNIVVMM